MSVLDDAAQDAYQDWASWQNEWNPDAIKPLRRLRERVADTTYPHFRAGRGQDRVFMAMAAYLVNYVQEWEKLEDQIRPGGAVAPPHILKRIRPEALKHMEKEA